MAYDYPETNTKLAYAQSQIEVRNRELVPNLKAQRQELVNRITKIDQLLQILEKNPDFIKMFDLTRELI